MFLEYIHNWNYIDTSIETFSERRLPHSQFKTSTLVGSDEPFVQSQPTLQSTSGGQSQAIHQQSSNYQQHSHQGQQTQHAYQQQAQYDQYSHQQEYQHQVPIYQPQPPAQGFYYDACAPHPNEQMPLPYIHDLQSYDQQIYDHSYQQHLGETYQYAQVQQPYGYEYQQPFENAQLQHPYDYTRIQHPYTLEQQYQQYSGQFTNQQYAESLDQYSNKLAYGQMLNQEQPYEQGQPIDYQDQPYQQYSQYHDQYLSNDAYISHQSNQNYQQHPLQIYPQTTQPGQQQPGQIPHEQRFPQSKRSIQSNQQPLFGERVKWRTRAQPQFDESNPNQERHTLHPFYHPQPTLQQRAYHMEHQPIIPEHLQKRPQIQQINLLPQRTVQHIQQPPQEHPFYHPQAILEEEQGAKQPPFMQQYRPHRATASRSRSRENTIDSLDRKDETPVWVQMKREKDKQRSKSLQPSQRLENIPWLHPKRDRSEPRQEPFLHGRLGVPIRPWIEEVIRLKRTELVQKVIERAELEKVALKKSQIERREISKEELEKIDLKCIQWEQALTQHFIGNQNDLQGQQGVIQQVERDFVIDKKRYEDNITILKLTQQIDELIQRDASNGVPWEVQKQQLRTIGNAQRMINRMDSEEHVYKQTGRFPTQPQEIVVQETITDVEDTIVLKLDREEHIESRQFIKNIEAASSKQAISHIEDSSFLNLSQHTEQNVKHIQKDEVPIMWQRGQKPRDVQKAISSQVEDSSFLQIQEESEQEFNRIQQEKHEEAVMWNRGLKQKQSTKATKSYQEDRTTLQIDRTSEEERPREIEKIEEEQGVMWQRGIKSKKSTNGSTKLQEDISNLQVDRTQETQEKTVTDQEEAKLWPRGLKKKPIPVTPSSHVEDSSFLLVDRSTEEETHIKDESDVEKPVMWARGKKSRPISQTALPHVEDISILDVSDDLKTDIQDIHSLETPVMWERGKKKPKLVDDVIQHVETITEEVDHLKIPEHPTSKEVPWLQSRKELKQVPRKKAPEPAKEHEMTQIQLKTTRKMSRDSQEPVRLAIDPKRDVSVEPTEAIDVPDHASSETPLIAEPMTGHPWRRGKKIVPDAERLEEKRWPTGKRKPKMSEDAGRVELKPLPKQKADEESETIEELDFIKTERDSKQDIRLTDKVQLKPTSRKKIEDKPAPERIELKSIPRRGIEEKQAILEDAPEQFVGKEILEYEETEEKHMMKILSAKEPKETVDEISVCEAEVEVAKPRVQKEKMRKADVVKKQVGFKEVVEKIETGEELTDDSPKLVIDRIKPPRFTKKLQPKKCVQHQPAVLECQIEGEPFPDIKWYFKNEELREDENIVSVIDKGVVALKIKQISEDQVGQYACEARNIGGLAVTRTNITLGKLIIS